MMVLGGNHDIETQAGGVQFAMPDLQSLHLRNLDLQAIIYILLVFFQRPRSALHFDILAYNRTSHELYINLFSIEEKASNFVTVSLKATD